MHYKTIGEGEKVFLLVHNAGGDHNFFEKQIHHLSQKHKVLAIDLPGHGNSSSNAKPSVSGYAIEIINLCEELKLRNINAIGLNYGSNIIIEISSIKHDLISSMIMIDPPIFLNQEVIALINNNIKSLQTEDSKTHANHLVDNSFIEANEKSKKIALQAFSKIDNRYLAQLYQELLTWDKNTKEKLKAINCPSLCISTDAALCSIEKITENNQKIKTSKVALSMYWATLEVPHQINTMIDRFILLND